VLIGVAQQLVIHLQSPSQHEETSHGPQSQP
jgi:hypothetical protein